MTTTTDQSPNLKLDWEEPGPDVRLSLVIMRGGLWVRDPTEADLTRALELLTPEVRGRVIGQWQSVLERKPQEVARRIVNLERELEEAKDLAGRMAVQAEEWREQAAKDKAVLGAVVDAMRRAVG